MKRVAYAVLMLTIINSCKPKTTGAFAVNGKFKNVQPQKIYLQELPLDGSQPVIADSGTLTPEGTFELRTIAAQQGLYFVGAPNGPDVIFINDNDHINIQLDANDFRHPVIEGSEASKSLYSFITNYVEKDSVVSAIYSNIDSVQNQPGNDSAIKVLQLEGLKEVTALNNYIKRFVRETASPAAAHFAIMQAARNQTMQNEELTALATAASGRFKDHKGLAFLKSKLAVEAQQSAEPASPLLNQQAPELTMNDATGKPVSISNFRGKYLLVDFWASWCAPCRQENPNVVAAYNEYKDKNFTILGVSLDSDKAAWLTAIKKDGLVWNHMSDLKQWESAAVSAYKFNGIPFNVLIDPQGKVIASNLRGPKLQSKLAEVLK